MNKFIKLKAYSLVETLITLSLFSVVIGSVMFLYREQLMRLEQSSAEFEEIHVLQRLENTLKAVLASSSNQFKITSEGAALVLNDTEIFLNNNALSKKQGLRKEQLLSFPKGFTPERLSFTRDKSIFTCRVDYSAAGSPKTKDLIIFLEP